MRPAFEVADILNEVWPQINTLKLSTWQLRTLNALRECRTASLGGHIDACDSCGHIVISYNSCRNRHCPKCQGQLREQWITARQAELLPVKYFHVVFTIPDNINRLCLFEPAKVYNILFKTAWEVMQAFCKDEKFLGAQTGMISILHTWGQNMSLHPHLHCIVPAGGIAEAKHWKHSKYVEKKNNKPFLFPVKAMRTMYRAKFVAALRKTFPQESKTFFKKLFEKKWVIYAKQPFAGPEQIIEYLGRYTHKIAISNHRILRVDTDTVTFSYKDYRDAAKNKQMTLSKEEFVRRFSMHILPKNFVRIRHYGILASGNKKKTREIVYSETNTPSEVERTAVHHSYKKPLYKCPCCKTGNMHLVEMFDERGPPEKWVNKIAAQKQHSLLKKITA